MSGRTSVAYKILMLLTKKKTENHDCIPQITTCFCIFAIRVLVLYDITDLHNIENSSNYYCTRFLGDNSF